MRGPNATDMHSDVRSSRTHDLHEIKNMHQDRIQSNNAKSLLRFLIGIRMAALSSLAAVALGLAACLIPEPLQAQEYPWCLSREGYLYCFYKTREQCQWTASGIGGCALNPRLLFPNKPRDSNASMVGPKSR
jgi:hypothetical protein